MVRAVSGAGVGMAVKPVQIDAPIDYDKYMPKREE
jgi:hypothetical protein